jgi:hypothetical protein
VVIRPVENTKAEGWPALAGRLIWWLLPIAFLFWLYSTGLRTWFLADDFAWLGLLRGVHSFHDVLSALFTPAAQGTIRPWSERGFFLLFESLFGLRSLPFRICVFATMTANLLLIVWITRRITGSLMAGSLAALLWSANAALVTIMAWNSSYNEAMCSLFLLSSLVLFIRYAETGRRVFWWWQLVVFVMGFGALEINVVYPALAAAYVLFVAARVRRKRLILSLLPLWCISIIYFGVHMAVAPLPKEGLYATHIDIKMLQTMATYWRWSFAPQARAVRSQTALFWIAAIPLAAFCIRELARRRYIVLFFVSWFLIALAPVLPLPAHITDYYVTIPLIGIAMLAGWGLSEAWRTFSLHRTTSLWRILALIPLCVYLGGMIPVSRISSQWWLDQSLAVRGLVLGVQAAERTHPGKTVVLDGITSSLFNMAFTDSAFTTVGLKEAYLTPGSEGRIHDDSDSGRLSQVVLAPGVLRYAIAHDDVVIYSDVGDHLRNITGAWEQSNVARLASAGNPDREPSRVDVANPLLAYLLGPEWFPVESGFRWMPRRATVRLGGPRSAKDQLILEGSCPDQQLKAGSLHLSVTADEFPLANIQLGIQDGNFHRTVTLPSSLIGRSAVTVGLQVDRVIRDSSGRDLGLVFGTIAIE